VSEEHPPESTGPCAILAVSSNKGGVGKTTVATNLAIYLRALLEDLPVLVIGLDDQRVIDRMFSVRPLGPGDGNLKHGWAERCFDRVIQLGEYGIHFVPSPPDTALLKARAEDPRTLRRILERTAWRGLVILDTKSDLESLTLNALFAADRIVIPVADRSSLDEASKEVALLERAGVEPRRARVLLTLVDHRSKLETGGEELFAHLESELRRRGLPRYEAVLPRSPRVEALISGHGRPRSLLHHAQGTQVHRQMRAFAEEVIAELGLAPGSAARPPPVASPRRETVTSLWKRALLRGTRDASS
jgi:cellulose biosynthesis protein BcsQ